MHVQRKLFFDPWLLLSAISLIAMGFIMVTSSSIPIAERFKLAAYYFPLHQAIGIILGGACFWAVTYIPSRVWQTFSVSILLTSILFLGVLLIPGVSREINDPPRHRRDGNHTPLGFLQVRQSRVDERVGSHHVGAEGFVPVGRVVAHYQGRDVGDHGVYSAAFGRAALDPGCDVFGLRDVNNGAVGAVGGVGGGEVGFGAAAVVDCCAFGEEGLHDCFAD